MLSLAPWAPGGSAKHCWSGFSGCFSAWGGCGQRTARPHACPARASRSGSRGGRRGAVMTPHPCQALPAALPTCSCTCSPPSPLIHLSFMEVQTEAPNYLAQGHSAGSSRAGTGGQALSSCRARVGKQYQSWKLAEKAEGSRELQPPPGAAEIPVPGREMARSDGAGMSPCSPPICRWLPFVCPQSHLKNSAAHTERIISPRSFPRGERCDPRLTFPKSLWRIYTKAFVCTPTLEGMHTRVEPSAACPHRPCLLVS